MCFAGGGGGQFSDDRSALGRQVRALQYHGRPAQGDVITRRHVVTS